MSNPSYPFSFEGYTVYKYGAPYTRTISKRTIINMMTLVDRQLRIYWLDDKGVARYSEVSIEMSPIWRFNDDYLSI